MLSYQLLINHPLYLKLIDILTRPNTPWLWYPWVATASHNTYAANSSSSYIYYQPSDNTFVENLWDSTSVDWIPNNITIEINAPWKSSLEVMIHDNLKQIPRWLAEVQGQATFLDRKILKRRDKFSFPAKCRLAPRRNYS